MKKIALVTSTRAEYGLLAPVLRELRKRENSNFKVDLIVTGTHLSKEYGRTIDEIKERIDLEISIPVDSSSDIDISRNQAQTLIKFTEVFEKEHYDGIVLLGDRYEILAVAIAAGNTRTPIFHLCGGDTTEGAIDEWIRHSITKISYLHFVTNDESRNRVIQLGEDPDRVFNYGSTSIDNIRTMADMKKTEVLNSIEMGDCRYALCTYHPVTMENSNIDELMTDFLEAIKTFPNIEFIVTKSNSDRGGSRINEILGKEEKNIDNLHVFSSLGTRRYLSLMRYAEFVLGNSSSGIIETPAFHIPTVNIGDRQKGRLHSESIIDCSADHNSIINAIRRALDSDFKAKCKIVKNLYGDGHSTEMISRKIIEVIESKKIDLKKKFYEVNTL